MRVGGNLGTFYPLAMNGIDPIPQGKVILLTELRQNRALVGSLRGIDSIGSPISQKLGCSWFFLGTLGGPEAPEQPGSHSFVTVMSPGGRFSTPDGGLFDAQLKDPQMVESGQNILSASSTIQSELAFRAELSWNLCCLKVKIIPLSQQNGSFFCLSLSVGKVYSFLLDNILMDISLSKITTELFIFSLVLK